MKKALRFFRERGENFMWPAYSSGCEILQKEGLIYAGDLTAMMLSPSDIYCSAHDDRAADAVIPESDDAEDWARTSWQGFGGGIDEVPEDYYDFMNALKDAREGVRLYSAKYQGRTAGVFLLTNEAEMTGLYYFAVVPEFRRHGIARCMMNEICRLSIGKSIVLQSTPMGEKFYRNYGFQELFRIPVYSTEEDIF